MKHIIDTVRAFLLMVGRKELIELTLPIRKRVSPLATFAQFGLVLDAKLIRSGTLQPDSDPGISFRSLPNQSTVFRLTV
jgi:hypothetical protein